MKIIDWFKRIFKGNGQKRLGSGEDNAIQNGKQEQRDNFLEQIRIDPDDPENLLSPEICNEENLIQNILKSMKVPQQFIDNPAFASAVQKVISRNKIYKGTQLVINKENIDQIKDSLAQYIVVDGDNVGLVCYDGMPLEDKDYVSLDGSSFGEYIKGITKRRTRDEINLVTLNGERARLIRQMDEHGDSDAISEQLASIDTEIALFKNQLNLPSLTYMEFSKADGQEIKLVETKRTCIPGQEKISFDEYTKTFDKNGIMQTEKSEFSNKKRYDSLLYEEQMGDGEELDAYVTDGLDLWGGGDKKSLDEMTKSNCSWSKDWSKDIPYFKSKRKQQISVTVALMKECYEKNNRKFKEGYAKSVRYEEQLQEYWKDVSENETQNQSR